MPSSRTTHGWLAILWSLWATTNACLLTGTGFAAEKPELTRLFPAGGQIGTTVDVEATGKFPVWPIQAWSDTPLIEWTCLKDSGKLQAKIAANTAPGLHWLRLHHENGATAIRPFLVGEALERNEVEPNDRPSEANKIDSLPQTIQGILNKRADVDLYAVSLEKGQMLVPTIDSTKWLQSPADVNLQMLDTKGFVLAENLDHTGLDPYLEFTAPRAGTYIVRVFGFPAAPDSTVAFSGGNDWNYRLRLDSKPCPFGSWLDFDMQSEMESDRIESVPGTHVNHENALLIKGPSKIGGVLTEARQANYLRFTARAGVNHRIRVFAREFGSSLDPTVAILDAKGKQLVQQDDVANHPDPDLRWKAPGDGEYLIEINDFHRLGGADYRFIAMMEERPANFSLSLANDLLASNIGKESEVTVTIDRESDFKGTINITAEGLPATSECSLAESKDGSDTSKKVTLKLKSTAAFQGPIKIVAKANEPPEMVRYATVPKGKTAWLSVTAE
ncbi:MAG: PPC domain-containing protein [Planctomycetota bacterium]|nr:PPC domain-containing protein [Planctomycetota bacterium]